jgi:hypothetical protein
MAKLREKRTSIAAVRAKLGQFNTFQTPLLSHCRLPLRFTFSENKSSSINCYGTRQCLKKYEITSCSSFIHILFAPSVAKIYAKKQFEMSLMVFLDPGEGDERRNMKSKISGHSLFKSYLNSSDYPFFNVNFSYFLISKFANFRFKKMESRLYPRDSMRCGDCDVLFPFPLSYILSSVIPLPSPTPPTPPHPPPPSRPPQW